LSAANRQTAVLIYTFSKRSTRDGRKKCVQPMLPLLEAGGLSLISRCWHRAPEYHHNYL